MAWPRCSKHKHGEYLGAGVNVIHDCTVTGRRGRCEYQVGKVYHNSSLSQQQRRAGVEQQLLYNGWVNLPNENSQSYHLATYSPPSLNDEISAATIPHSSSPSQ